MVMQFDITISTEKDGRGLSRTLIADEDTEYSYNLIRESAKRVSYLFVTVRETSISILEKVDDELKSQPIINAWSYRDCKEDNKKAILNTLRAFSRENQKFVQYRYEDRFCTIL